MKILSIDTASNICGVSILENEKLICNKDINPSKKTHSENLMPLIDSALKNSNLNLRDIDLVVCDIGPGSFTGLRIGIATTKAFCDSQNIPCIGISSLEALAYNTLNAKTTSNYICSIIDCKNDNCYFALYENNNGDICCLIEPQAESIEGALAILNSYCLDTLDSASIAFIGDGSENYKSKICEIFPNAEFIEESSSNILNSYSLGLAGFNKYYAHFEQPEISPLYLRKPQAERMLEEKMNKGL